MTQVQGHLRYTINPSLLIPLHNCDINPIYYKSYFFCLVSECCSSQWMSRPGLENQIIVSVWLSWSNKGSKNKHIQYCIQLTWCLINPDYSVADYICLLFVVYCFLLLPVRNHTVLLFSPPTTSTCPSFFTSLFACFLFAFFLINMFELELLLQETQDSRGACCKGRHDDVRVKEIPEQYRLFQSFADESAVFNSGLDSSAASENQFSFTTWEENHYTDQEDKITFLTFIYSLLSLSFISA